MKKLLLFLIIFTFLTPVCNAQNKLDKVEKKFIKKEDENHPSYTQGIRGSVSSGSNKNSYDDETDNIFYHELGSLFIQLFAYASYGTLFGYSAEQNFAAHKASITKYPYYNSKKGNYSYTWGEDTKIARTTISNRMIIENSKLYGNHLNAELNVFKRLTLEADYLQLWEKNTFLGRNTLASYTLLAKYNRVRTQKFDLNWGLGATYLDGEINQWGVTFALGGELFFAKPLSAEMNINHSIYTENEFTKVNGLLNYHINCYKISGGYEYLDIGGIDFSTFSMGVGVSF